MSRRTRITEAARERGFTAREVAQRLGLYPSNISSADAGRRPISLGVLTRIAQLLSCSVDDLLQEDSNTDPIYHNQALNRWLELREKEVPEGTRRDWVHATMLAWQRHAGFKRKSS